VRKFQWTTGKKEKEKKSDDTCRKPIHSRAGKSGFSHDEGGKYAVRGGPQRRARGKVKEESEGGKKAQGRGESKNATPTEEAIVHDKRALYVTMDLTITSKEEKTGNYSDPAAWVSTALSITKGWGEL